MHAHPKTKLTRQTSIGPRGLHALPTFNFLAFTTHQRRCADVASVHGRRCQPGKGYPGNISDKVKYQPTGTNARPRREGPSLQEYQEVKTKDYAGPERESKEQGHQEADHHQEEVGNCE